ncbi:MAG: class I SAM-dependent methyltransferase [Candidatus Sumerlaeota bacterium]|nr:class I SAM-dependent methyltransferase [Candidatus Sumerlaeota bacterium]
MSMGFITLKPGREKALARRHPWVFAGAIEKVEGSPRAGETVDLRSAEGAWMARGAWSPQSQIAVRVWSFESEEAIDSAFFRARLERAIARRGLPANPEAPLGRRLVNAESDGLPGLIIDRYGGFLVCQFLSAGAEFWRQEIVALLAELSPAAGVYERSDVDVRAKEGLAPRTGVLRGEEPPERIEIHEGPCRFLVDVKHGHKTGFYLDQRENRSRAADYAAGAETLNGFAYTGAFGVRALCAGAARVVNLESSAPALELARRNAELNGLDSSRVENTEGDAFQVLRRYRDARREFDLVILDPPKFAESRAQLERAARGYKDINLLAFKLLRPGGTLFTFSCSGLMTPELFQKIVADAALDAGREAQIVGRLAQADDHPAALAFPEGAYLKGLICRV